MEYQTKSKKALGIDPGLANCGWAVVGRNSKGKYVLMSHGSIQTDKLETEAARLLSIYKQVSELIYTHSVHSVVVERVFFNENVTSCLTTAGVSAICLLAAEQAGIASSLVTPQKVKAAVTGRGTASKAEVQKFVGRLTGHELKNAHAADAAACAVAGLLCGQRNDGKVAG